MGEILVFSNRIFSGSSWPLIVFNIMFRISVTWASQNVTVVKTKIGQGLLINNLLSHNVVVLYTAVKPFEPVLIRFCVAAARNPIG